MKKHYREDKTCLNCAYPVEKNFCSNCGQENLELKEPFWHFVGHSISHYFHFDSKFFHTIKPLLTRPGRLTLEYMNGRRTTFLHPVSMYIFVSIVYFLVVPHMIESNEDESESVEDVRETKPLPLDSVRRMETEFVELPLQNRRTVVGKTMHAAAREVRISNFRKLSYTDQQKYIDSLKGADDSKSDSARKLMNKLRAAHQEKGDSTYEAYLSHQAQLPANMQDDWITKLWKKRDIEIARKTQGNWSLQNEIKKYNPKLYFLLMPLFAFFLMLNFRKNKKYYVEHLIFTIHFFTAFFIFQILATPIDHYLFNNDSYLYNLAEFSVIVWYVYSALTVFYQRKKWTTVRKMVGLSFLMLIAYGICYGLVYSFVFLTA